MAPKGNLKLILRIKFLTTQSILPEGPIIAISWPDLNEHRIINIISKSLIKSAIIKTAAAWTLTAVIFNGGLSLP